jgi:hypothetical protein
MKVAKPETAFAAYSLPPYLGDINYSILVGLIARDLGRDSADSRRDLGQSKMRIFLRTGLDRHFTGKPVGQISENLLSLQRLTSSTTVSLL